MSTAKADLITDRLGTKSPSVFKADFVRAWGAFAGASGAPVTYGYAFGMSSWIDLGVGYAGLNTIATMNSTNFAVLATAWARTNWSGKFEGAVSATVARADMYHGEAGAACDPHVAQIMVCGVLA